MRYSHLRILLALASLMVGTTSQVFAQTPAEDPSVRLRQVLPADVAARVLARIAEARTRDLPAAALENRALKFAAKGVAPADIEKSVTEQGVRMLDARTALAQGRAVRPAHDEIEAGAEAMRKGVSGAGIAALARSAPSGRSLAVPLFVVGGLMDRGLPSDAALSRVQERLQARVSDADLQGLPADVTEGGVRKPAQVGRDAAATKRPADAGAGADRRGKGPPAGVPANGGAGARPTGSGKGRKP